MPARFFALCAFLVLACHATPAFLLRDLPAALGVVWLQAPWRWDWSALALLAAHTAAFLVVLAGAGTAAGRLQVLRRTRGFERAAFALGAGVGMLGTTILGLGLCGLTGRPAILTVYAIFGTLGLWESRQLAAMAERVRWRWPGTGWAGGGRSAVIVVSMWIALFGLADLLAPEAFWDALVYHLAAPRHWLLTGRIAAVEPFATNFPLLMSMNYLVALAVHGEQLARTLNLVCGLTLVVVAASVARGWLDGAAVRRGAILALTSPLLVLLALHAGADTATALFTLLALLAVVRACPRWPAGSIHRGWVVGGGGAAGGGAATKPQGLAVPILLCLFVAAARGAGPGVWTAFVLPAAAGCLPWEVKSWLLTGDPVFPFLSGICASPLWTEFSRRAYADELAGVRNQLSVLNVQILGDAGGVIARFRGGLVGPVPVLAVCALVLRPWAPGMRLPALFVAALAAGWAATVPAWRFLAAGLVLFPFFLVRREETRAGRAIAAAAVLLQLAWIPLVLDINDRPWEAARGRAGRTAYYAMLHLNSDLDAVEMQEKFGTTTPRRRTLTVGDVCGFLMPRYAIVASWFEPTPLMRWASESPGPERLYVRLKQRGVRFILVNPGEVIRTAHWTHLVWDRPRPRRTLRAFFSRHTSLAYARSNGWVYFVSRRATGAQVPECLDGGTDPGFPTASICVEEGRAALMAGEGTKAVRFGWAAVAAAPHSGMAWATLGDCLYGQGKWEEAANIYKTAAMYGCTTSVVYRNCALAYAKTGDWTRARQAMGYALSLDPASRRVQEDLNVINDRMFEEMRRSRMRGRAAGEGAGL
ncbi:MAG: hypothetical protein AAB152_08400 [Candidatus Coatesbacteria bacterium]